MAGLTGIIGSCEEHETYLLLNKMLKCMVHEKFYRYETHIDKKACLVVGWTYFNDDQTDQMPVWNEHRDVYIILAGKLFISNGDVKWIRSRGHNLPHNNYDLLVHLYEEYEEDFFEKLNGQFAGVLVDLRKKVSYLFNDRFGFGRIYYREEEGKVFFSTEAKSLLMIFPDARAIDPVALSEIFACGCTLKNRCLFKKISILPPATLWKFEKDSQSMKYTYLSEGFVRQSEYIDRGDYYQKIKMTLQNILPRYLEANRLIGMSITGGKDTRIILAWADFTRTNLRCYTFGSIYRKNRDEKIAEIVAKACGLPFSVIKVGGEFFRSFPKLAEKTIYITDGLMDVSGAPGLYTNRIARDLSPIRLTGNYGQEIFEGYVAFKPTMISEKFVNDEFMQLLRDARSSYQEEKRNCDKYSFILLKQLPWYHYSRYKLESSQVIMYSPFLDNDLIKVISNTPLAIRQSSDYIRTRLYYEGNPVLAEIETDLGYKYCDKSLFQRLNIVFQEFTFKAEYAYNVGMPNWLAFIDYVFKPLHLEKLFLGRHKINHFRIWYRDILPDYIKEILLDKRTLSRPFINRRAVERIVLNHTKGIRNYTFEIHQLLTMELIYRQLLEAQNS